MLDFAKTAIGRKFFDGQIPALIEALGSIAIAVARLAKATEAQPKSPSGPYAPVEIHIDPSWWEEEDEDETLWGRFFLNVPTECGGPGLSVRGAYRYHVLAFRVAKEGDEDYEEGVQSAANPHWREAFEAIWSVGGAEQRLTTIDVDGHECIMAITPFS